nr:protein like COV 1-like [Tanacetum cinerariifolium]
MGLKRVPSNESLECSKDHVMNVKNSDHDQHTKRPIIRSKKLCLSNKNLQKEVPGPTKRVDDVLPGHLGERMENLLEVQKETDIPEYAVGSKRLSGIGRKVSPDASASNTRVIDTGMNKAPPNKSHNQEPNQDSKELPFQIVKISLGEWFIKRMPFVRHIYDASKQISAAISPDQNSRAFQEVVIIKHPRAGEYAFGFITSSFILQSDTGEEELYSVYVPTNHLYIGDIFLVNSKEVIRPNLSVREGIEIVVSGGMSMPQLLTTSNSGLSRYGPRNNKN